MFGIARKGEETKKPMQVKTKDLPPLWTAITLDCVASESVAFTLLKVETIVSSLSEQTATYVSICYATNLSMILPRRGRQAYCLYIRPAPVGMAICKRLAGRTLHPSTRSGKPDRHKWDCVSRSIYAKIASPTGQGQEQKQGQGGQDLGELFVKSSPNPSKTL